MSTDSRTAALPSRPAVLRTAATLAVALLGLVLMVLSAPGAAAHNTLISSDPADGATVATAPEQITLTFNEPAQALGSEIVVTGPDGATVSEGAVELVDATVTQALAADLPAGAYAVTWRVTSADGHPIDGTLSFTVEAGSDGAAAVDPAEEATAAPEPTADDAAPATDQPTVIATAPADATAEDEDAGLAAGAIVAIVVGVLALAAVVAVVIHERRKARTPGAK